MLCPALRRTPAPARSTKHTAADFKPQLPPLSTFVLKGEDMSLMRAASLRDIGRSFWEGRKRERASRVVKVGGFDVLKENHYSMEEVRARGARGGQGRLGRGATACAEAGDARACLSTAACLLLPGQRHLQAILT